MYNVSKAIKTLEGIEFKFKQLANNFCVFRPETSEHIYANSQGFVFVHGKYMNNISFTKILAVIDILKEWIYIHDVKKLIEILSNSNYTRKLANMFGIKREFHNGTNELIYANSYEFVHEYGTKKYHFNFNETSEIMYILKKWIHKYVVKDLIDKLSEADSGEEFACSLGIRRNDGSGEHIYANSFEFVHEYISC